MLFKYKVVTKTGEQRSGAIEALNEDVAISSLQRRGLIIVSIADTEKTSIFEMDIAFLSRVKSKDVVILSRQIATLFEAQVPALRAFQLLATESSNSILRKALNKISTDIQSGTSISEALKKHPSIFSDFYVNMVRSGEESGKIADVFLYLADYIDRTYELTSKIKGALTYPAFVISIFLVVMIGLFTFIIPNISGILKSNGGELPVPTKIVLAISNFLVHYGLFTLIIAIIAGFLFWRFGHTNKSFFSKVALSIPAFGNLLQKLYLARLSDNMHTMLSSGIPMVRAIEITADVVGNELYKAILLEAVEKIKGGEPMSKSLSGNDVIPSMFIQMVRVGEETGELGNILGKIAIFYEREVDTAVDTLISLIEPAMIVLLGVGVGGVLASVLMPIYNLAGNM